MLNLFNNCLCSDDSASKHDDKINGNGAVLTDRIAINNDTTTIATTHSVINQKYINNPNSSSSGAYRRLSQLTQKCPNFIQSYRMCMCLHRKVEPGDPNGNGSNSNNLNGTPIIPITVGPDTYVHHYTMWFLICFFFLS